MKKISDEELRKVLNLHEKWLKDEEDGVRADLGWTDLSNRDLSHVNLSFANLDYAILENSDLSYSIFTGTNFSYAKLKNSDLSVATFNYANFFGADLDNNNLNYSNFNCAIFNDANLTTINYKEKQKLFALQCPEKGSFIGYKAAITERGHLCIIELLIPKDAKRSSATSRKCRCSKAKVLSITSIDGAVNYSLAHSVFDENFIYRVGETVEVKDFDENRWDECSTGIHFFITRGEAASYYC